jgi:hypothetical protein
MDVAALRLGRGDFRTDYARPLGARSRPPPQNADEIIANLAVEVR